MSPTSVAHIRGIPGKALRQHFSPEPEIAYIQGVGAGLEERGSSGSCLARKRCKTKRELPANEEQRIKKGKTTKVKCRWGEWMMSQRRRSNSLLIYGPETASKPRKRKNTICGFFFYLHHVLLLLLLFLFLFPFYFPSLSFCTIDKRKL